MNNVIIKYHFTIIKYQVTVIYELGIIDYVRHFRNLSRTLPVAFRCQNFHSTHGTNSFLVGTGLTIM